MRSFGVFVAWAIAAFLVGCDSTGSPNNEEALHFHLNDSTEAVFPVVRQSDEWRLTNGSETLFLPRIGDQLFAVPVFNGSMQLTNDPYGYWTDSLRPTTEDGVYRVDYRIEPHTTQPASDSIFGTWDVWFEATPGESAATAQLDIRSTDSGVAGTIRTPTGDYRFLTGHFHQQELHLQTFDGAHLYAITASREGNQWVDGHFYSGNHYHTPWSGVEADPWPMNESVEAFHVPLDSLYVHIIKRTGESERLSLIPREGQTFIVDILGSWCPNCMDEVRLLQALHQEGESKILSIAFERPENVEQAFARMDAFQSLMNIPWDVHLGGKASKTIAAAAFPFLDEVISFPTTLFIQSNGHVAVHSGFNGPATGARYIAEQATFQRLSKSYAVTSLESH